MGIMLGFTVSSDTCGVGKEAKESMTRCGVFNYHVLYWSKGCKERQRVSLLFLVWFCFVLFV